MAIGAFDACEASYSEMRAGAASECPLFFDLCALRAALRGREPALRRLSRRVDGGWGSAAGRSAAGHNCYGPGRASARQQCDIIKATPRGMSNILPLEENNAWLWNIRK